VFLAKTAKAKFSFLGENSKNEALVFRRKAAKAKLIANSGQREKTPAGRFVLTTCGCPCKSGSTITLTSSFSILSAKLRSCNALHGLLPQNKQRNAGNNADVSAF